MPLTKRPWSVLAVPARALIPLLLPGERGPMNNGSNGRPADPLAGSTKPLTETFTITAVRGGTPGPYGADLTRLPNGPFSTEDDLHWRLGLLFPLREWLDAHGAMTSGSGVWVHVLSHDERPEDVAEAGPVDGTVIGACRVTTTMDGRPRAFSGLG